MPVPDDSTEVTQLLQAFRRGEPAATEKLMSLVYAELRRIAGHYMRNEAPGHTLQPTALVHEAYVKLVHHQDATWESRAHFMGFAAQLMRHLLIDHARARTAAKRGGIDKKVSLDNVSSPVEQKTDEWLAIDGALQRLARIDPRQERVVELRYFGGLSVEETAEVLGVSPKTVKRDWSMARAWLHRELQKA